MKKILLFVSIMFSICQVQAKDFDFVLVCNANAPERGQRIFVSNEDQASITKTTEYFDRFDLMRSGTTPSAYAYTTTKVFGGGNPKEYKWSLARDTLKLRLEFTMYDSVMRDSRTTGYSFECQKSTNPQADYDKISAMYKGAVEKRASEERKETQQQLKQNKI